MFQSKKQGNYLQTCELVFGASFLGFQHFVGTIIGRPTTTTDFFIDGMTETETETELNRKNSQPASIFFFRSLQLLFFPKIVLENTSLPFPLR